MSLGLAATSLGLAARMTSHGPAWGRLGARVTWRSRGPGGGSALTQVALVLWQALGRHQGSRLTRSDPPPGPRHHRYRQGTMLSAALRAGPMPALNHHRAHVNHTRRVRAKLPRTLTPVLPCSAHRRPTTTRVICPEGHPALQPHRPEHDPSRDARDVPRDIHERERCARRVGMGPALSAADSIVPWRQRWCRGPGGGADRVKREPYRRHVA